MVAEPVGHSAQKHQAYRSYARGEIGLHELTTRVSRVTPRRAATGWRRLAGVVVGLVSALILPHWGAKRD